MDSTSVTCGRRQGRYTPDGGPGGAGVADRHARRRAERRGSRRTWGACKAGGRRWRQAGGEGGQLGRPGQRNCTGWRTTQSVTRICANGGLRRGWGSSEPVLGTPPLWRLG